jgi:hypothetical protein
MLFSYYLEGVCWWHGGAHGLLLAARASPVVQDHRFDGSGS